MGNRKSRRKLESDLVKKPLILCGKSLPESKTIKYLGDYLSADLEESAHQTVMKRLVIVKQVIYEIRAVIEDSRADRIGSLELAFGIWESAVVPMLLQNSESWLNIPRKTLKMLNDMFHRFCQVIFWVSSGCPIPGYYWQSASTKFSILIIQRKLNFAHHLSNLALGDLGRDVYDLQVEHGLGLFSEVKEHLDAIRISDLKVISKWQ